MSTVETPKKGTEAGYKRGEETVYKPADEAPLAQRLKFFINPIDGRYEDLRRGDWRLNIFRDFTAGLIVAMVAIPLAMGFAMASGLRPEQGIVGGAIAGLVGALWGGSKYQVYGPTAAFIPVIAGVMAKYDHGVLVLASLIAGIILIGFGRIHDRNCDHDRAVAGRRSARAQGKPGIRILG